MRKIAFYTLGCKVNIYDTESLWEVFKKENYKRVDFSDFADVYIINTCTVTNQSDSKSRKFIRQAIRKNENAIIVAMGCYTQLKPDDVISIPGVDIVSGTQNRRHIVKLVDEIYNERHFINAVKPLNKQFDDLSVKNYTENTRAFLKIQDGCNSFCSYCIIPFARGDVVSKPVEKVISETKTLIAEGYKEIVLTGIHTGKYGLDIGYSITEIVKDLLELDGLFRLRISSIEINEITDELIDTMKNNPKLAKHLHIPIQSGSNAVLKDMNRKYDKDYFIDRLNDIRIVSGISITTDCIVGYPTETEELFLETLDTIEKCEFADIHIFPYSKRNGTKSSRLKDLDKKIKTNRVNKLTEIKNRAHFEYMKRFIGTIQEVIIEASNSYSAGYTSNYIKTIIYDTLDINQVYRVKIVRIEAEHCVGEII